MSESKTTRELPHFTEVTEATVMVALELLFNSKPESEATHADVAAALRAFGIRAQRDGRVRSLRCPIAIYLNAVFGFEPGWGGFSVGVTIATLPQPHDFFVHLPGAVSSFIGRYDTPGPGEDPYADLRPV